MTKKITKLMYKGATYRIKEFNPWITLYDGSSIAQGAGIFHETTTGVISVSADGQNWITIADKNLGATTVYNDGDVLSETNCGGHFQRGNNYMFPWAGSVTTSNIQVDASSYGPGNYYSSSTFITSNFIRSSVQNNDLWGDVTDTLAARQGPCSSGYHIPTNNEYGALVNALTALGINTSNGNCVKTYLKMPFAGSRSRTWSAEVNYQDIRAYYWSSTMDNDGLAYCIGAGSANFYYNNGTSSSFGYSIRPFKNDPIHP